MSDCFGERLCVRFGESNIGLDIWGGAELEVA